VTGGTGVTYTVTSYQGFDSLANMNGKTIAFTPHTTNTQTQAFLNVDGLGAKTIRSATGVDIPAGTLIQGTPYTVTFNNLDGVFYLHGFYGNPYSIPLGATLDYWLPTSPNSAFVFPFGQPISRSTYATLFAAMGTTYGPGDGSTTFNLPDLRGRVVASPDNMGGGTDPNRLTGSPTLALVRNSIGGTGGAAGVALSTSNLPPYTPSGSISNGAITTTVSGSGAAGGGTGLAGGPGNQFSTLSASSSQATSTFSGSPQGGTSALHENAQSTILGNRIMRII
jgi:microcystin-dependent protein